MSKENKEYLKELLMAEITIYAFLLIVLVLFVDLTLDGIWKGQYLQTSIGIFVSIIIITLVFCTWRSIMQNADCLAGLEEKEETK